jgi:putative SOS response-associated peptidase YedK
MGHGKPWGDVFGPTATYPAEEMACWSVSARVGNVKNNDPSLIEPIGVQ